MEGITIQIDWPYALGIMGSLLAIAWYASGRFSKIETSLEGVKERVKDMKENVSLRIEELKTDVNNIRLNAFSSNSPISLTEKGWEILNESGLKEYIDTKKDTLLTACSPKKETNPYEVQEHVFTMFSEYTFEEEIYDTLQIYAFEKGIPMDIIRRVGAIYFRDICLTSFGMNAEELGKKEELYP